MTGGNKAKNKAFIYTSLPYAINYFLYGKESFIQAPLE